MSCLDVYSSSCCDSTMTLKSILPHQDGASVFVGLLSVDTCSTSVLAICVSWAAYHFWGFHADLQPSSIATNHNLVTVVTFHLLTHWWIVLIVFHAAFLIEGKWRLGGKWVPSSSVGSGCPWFVHKHKSTEISFYPCACLIWGTSAIFLSFLTGLCCLTAVLVRDCIFKTEWWTSQTSAHWPMFITHDHC